MPISDDPARILIIHPGSPADLCHCVPLAVSLQRAYPSAKIDWAIRDAATAILAAHPATNEVLALPQQPLRRWRIGFRAPANVREHLRFLRDRGYDLVIDACGRGGIGRIARATRAPVCLGPADSSAVERLGNTARSALESAGRTTHLVDRALTLLEPISVEPAPDIRLFLREDDASWWRSRRGSLGLDPAKGPYAVIAPATRLPSKRWPCERWAELIGPLLYRGFERVIMIGAPEDRASVRLLSELGRDAHDGSDGDGPLIDLVGETDIGQMMAVIGSAGLVLAHDAAPLHVAAGLNRPCLGLFGPTDPAVSGPYRRPDAALRAFAPKPGQIVSPTDPKLGDRLMRVISTAAVIQRIDRVIDGAINEANCAAGSERSSA